MLWVSNCLLQLIAGNLCTHIWRDKRDNNTDNPERTEPYFLTGSGCLGFAVPN